MKLEPRRLEQIQVRHSKLDGIPPGNYIVWWYGAVQRNKRNRTLPLVVVFFRRLNEDGTLGSSFHRNVGITELGLLQIGTIWSESTCRQQLALEEKQFHVDFSPGGWRFENQKYHSTNNLTDLIPQSVYPLHYGRNDHSELLVFKLTHGQELLVPSLEFYSRCYGRSGEVNRVLATYGWEEVQQRLLPPMDVSFPPNHWPIKLATKVYDEDAVFLAHLKHDAYTQHVVKSVYSGLETQFDTAAGLSFPKISPWFSGRAELIVQGIWLDSKRFLGLRVVGGSEPRGPKIFWTRENPGEAEVSAPEDAPQGGRSGGRNFRPGEQPKVINPDDVPGQNGDIIAVRNPVFRIVGPRREKEVHKLRNAQTRPGPPVPREKSDQHSPGERGGSDNSTGVASLHTETVLDTHGAVWDVWEALCYLKQAQPSLIREVGWFSPVAGAFNFTGIQPCMTALLPFNAEQKIAMSPAEWKWVYMDHTQSKLRGVLVACVKTPTRNVYLFEVERRVGMRTDESGGFYEKEESFSGLVVSPPADLQPCDWIPRVLEGIRRHKGVMTKVMSYCPGNLLDDYRRSSSKDDEIAGHSTVISALGKVGIHIPHPKKKQATKSVRPKKSDPLA